MLPAETPVTTLTPVQVEPFRKKYKTEGLVATVVLMWIDFLLLYFALNSGNVGIMAFGMGVMALAVCLILYFG